MSLLGADFIRSMMMKSTFGPGIFGPVPVLVAPFGAFMDEAGVVHQTGMQPMDVYMFVGRATMCFPDRVVTGDTTVAGVTCLECLSVSPL